MNARDYYKLISADRDAWKREQPQACFWCGKANVNVLEVHEMVRRSSAPKSWGHRSNYLLLGGGFGCGCHDRVFGTMVIVVQLAVKWLRDRQNYSLEKIMEISPRKGITQEEVEVTANCIGLPPIQSSFPVF